ncbi:MAG: phenylalanine--tRNA ligase subunit beta [Desulfovibrio sp.]|jgi:phenylalanyl-tRNA synthetase beta chain|nr:phenylalanine--tRNA ligase subunit beta [Desulfovibrio sp.]
MLLSLSWLCEFTPYEGNAEALGDRLTMLGLELENILRPYAAISAIVVGEVTACVKHPESDHLHLCKVNAGQEYLLDIVCGAPNVAAGQKVPVALVGTRLPDGTVIRKAKLRGAPSFGMICSERELGMTEDHSGIMVLPEDALPGARLVDTLDLDTEVLDISITPNRSDCLSVLGLARETANAFHLPVTIQELPVTEDKTRPEALVPIDIENADLCRLYSGRVIADIRAAPSPPRVRRRLHAMGVRPISNIVDVTNYILLECGQPLHAFDLDKLRGGRIAVRTAQNNEKFTTLDGQERALTNRDLCICDAERIVGLAGVMGGLNTEITQTSRNVFLESAVFKPESIRKTSRRLGLSSEASCRFERGIDQRRTVWALDRACAMMAAFGGGVVRRGLSRAEPKPFAPVAVAFRPEKADALLGVTLNREFCEATLTRLGCVVNKGSVWRVTQPSWRPDLTREADLIEEVGRMHGLDAIPPVLPPMCKSLDRAGQSRSDYFFLSRVKHWGAGLGLNEAVNYSFVGHKDLDHLGLPRQGRISIVNPLSAEQDVLRTSLAPGLLQSLRNNLAQGAQGLRLFELAHIFEEHADADVAPAQGQLPTAARETGMLGILLYGARYDVAWPHAEEDMDYADIKGIAEHLLNFLHLPAPGWETVNNHPWLLPCVEMRLAGRTVGCMGRVKSALADAFHARKGVWLAEFNLDALCAMHDMACVRFTPLPVYPPVRRDITVIAGPTLRVSHVLDHMAKLALPLLAEALLADVFEPQEGAERHLTFRLTFRHPSRTLKDAEVDKEREKVAQSLVEALGVRV